jgi:hypothetical protein
MQGNRRLHVFQLLAETIGKAREPTHGHPHRQILTLNVAAPS